MIIKRELKGATFTYDESTKSFSVSTPEGQITLNKVYAFALTRFIFRLAQRNWLRQKKLDKLEESMIESDDEENNNPNQLEMF